MIVRDEGRFLRSCLESLEPWVDEICVVDTGSTDSTMEIARDFGATVIQIEWIDDFSTARNASLAMATKPWIFVVNADEHLAPNSGPQLRSAVQSNASAYVVSQDHRNSSGELQARHVARLFRNHRKIEFRHPVHESIVDSLAELGLPLEKTSGIHLVNAGHVPGVVEQRGKRERNERILRQHLKKNPEDIHCLHHLAMMLPTDCRERLDLYERALPIAEAMFDGGQADDIRFLPRVYANFVAALIQHGDLSRALRTIGVALCHFPGVGELQYQQADLALRLGHHDCADSVFSRVLRAPPPPPEYPADPSMRGLAAAVGMARAALEARRLRDALVAVRHVRSLAPGSGIEQALRLEILALSGQQHGMLEQLSAAMETEHVHSPPVQLFIGDHAWSQRDFDAALAMWNSAANPRTSVGQDALCRVALAEVCIAQCEASDALERVRDWSLEAASCRVVLALLANQSLESLSPALAPSALIPSITGWFEMVSDTGRTDLLKCLAVRASRNQDAIPGIEGLILCDVEDLAS